MALVQLRPQALPASALDALEALVGHPLIGPSPLAGSFRPSRGFALTFTEEGVGAAIRRFAPLEPFLAMVRDPRAHGAVAPLWERIRPTRIPNAFYLNLLVLPLGEGVGRHTDATLRGPTGLEALVPERVSVLYLCVPGGEGGELVLYRGERQIRVVRPERGLGVHFRGSLEHEIRAAQGAGMRVSLVCEQYHLEPGALARLGPLQVHSRAGFGAHLDAHRDAPGGRPFTLESE